MTSSNFDETQNSTRAEFQCALMIFNDSVRFINDQLVTSNEKKIIRLKIERQWLLFMTFCNLYSPIIDGALEIKNATKGFNFVPFCFMIFFGTNIFNISFFLQTWINTCKYFTYGFKSFKCFSLHTNNNFSSNPL